MGRMGSLVSCVTLSSGWEAEWFRLDLVVAVEGLGVEGAEGGLGGVAVAGTEGEAMAWGGAGRAVGALLD